MNNLFSIFGSVNCPLLFPSATRLLILLKNGCPVKFMVDFLEKTVQPLTSIFRALLKFVDRTRAPGIEIPKLSWFSLCTQSVPSFAHVTCTVKEGA